MYQRILVPVDGSPTSDAGLAEAISLAQLTGGRIRLLHVVDDLPFAMAAEGYAAMSSDVLAVMNEAGEAVLKRALERVRGAPVAVETVLVPHPGGRLADRVLQQASEWPADLVVLGTHGRRGVGRVLMGSDAEQVARTAPVPVLLVRAPNSAKA
ncbi:MAG: universal stress protein [Rhizobacter sp.]|jgi:nucleotide-binding universal stress UspA family protein